MKWFIFVLVFLLIFSIFSLLFSRIKIRVYKRGINKGEVDIYLSLIKHIHIDVGRILKKYIENYSIGENVNKIKEFNKISKINKSLIDKLCKCVIIKRIIFIPGYNTTSPVLYPYITFVNWQIISIVKRTLNIFKKTEYEYYQVMMNDESKKGFNLDLLVDIPIRSIIYVFITNIKDTFKLIKTSKGGNLNGRKQRVN